MCVHLGGTHNPTIPRKFSSALPTPRPRATSVRDTYFLPCAHLQSCAQPGPWPPLSPQSPLAVHPQAVTFEAGLRGATKVIRNVAECGFRRPARGTPPVRQQLAVPRLWGVPGWGTPKQPFFPVFFVLQIWQFLPFFVLHFQGPVLHAPQKPGP